MIVVVGMAILLVGICSFGILGNDTRPAFEEYWDLDACGDLSYRIGFLLDAGLSDDQIYDSLGMVDSGVREYGFDIVILRCAKLLEGVDP